MLSEAAKQHIDHWLQKYPADQKRSAVVAALLYVQKENGGWLSEPQMEAVAAYLGLAPIEVFEVATFYDMFELKPIGKHKIAVCTTLACQLRGSNDILACIKKRLGVGVGETTADGRFTITSSQCLAACGGAPMCQVDDEEYHLNLTPDKMVAIIDGLENGSVDPWVKPKDDEERGDGDCHSGRDPESKSKQGGDN